MVVKVIDVVSKGVLYRCLDTWSLRQPPLLNSLVYESITSCLFYRPDRRISIRHYQVCGGYTADYLHSRVE